MHPAPPPTPRRRHRSSADCGPSATDPPLQPVQKRPRPDDPPAPPERDPVSSPEGCSHDSDDDLVLSEVHIHPTNGRVDGRTITSVFHLNSTAQDLNHDPQVDPETAEDTFWDYAVDIQHAMGTTLGAVGSQVWMGCFLLVDWMVSMKDELSGSVALELGAGTGLASIALCLATDLDRIFCTDYGVEVLSNCGQNVHRNSRPSCSGQQASHRLEERILVRRYNWLMDDPRSPTDGPLDQFNWTAEECEEWRSKGAFVFGADVVYDDSLTDALIESLEKLLLEPLPESHPRHTIGRVAYLSMEKRFNFSIDQLDVVAQAHDYFVKRIGESRAIKAHRLDYSQLGRYCDYERSKDLELYRVVLRSSATNC